jgi:plastocyanin
MSRAPATLAVLLAWVAPFGAHAASIDVFVRDAAGKPVADVVVYAMPAAGASDARPGKTAQIAQEDREFVPFVSVIQAGTTVTFPNRDPILHHVYSFSPAKSFEIKLYTGKSPSQILFDKPGVVTLGCNIHDWMVAYMLVVQTPYFAKTDAGGAARLRDLPVGGYDLAAWHPQQRAAADAHRVVLDAASAPSLQFALDVAPRKPKFKPPLDRLKY